MLRLGMAYLAGPISASADGTRPLLQRLDPQTRGKVLMALLGLLLVGALLVVLTVLVFRMVRRDIRSAQQLAERHRERGQDEDDWARKPL